MTIGAVAAAHHPGPAPLLAFLGFAGGWEWLIVLVIFLLLFGHRIPGMARSLGSGITEFRKGLKGDGGGDTKAVEGDGSDPAQKNDSSK